MPCGVDKRKTKYIKKKKKKEKRELHLGEEKAIPAWWLGMDIRQAKQGGRR